MRITKQARREAKELYRACVREGQLDEGRVRAAVREVSARRPRGCLAVLAHFRRLVKLEVQRRSALVQGAADLPAGVQTGVVNTLGRLYGGGLRVAFARNPALIAGLRIRVGSDVFDGSIQAKLAILAENLA